jgi:hypothetical protein
MKRMTIRLTLDDSELDFDGFEGFKVGINWSVKTRKSF